MVPADGLLAGRATPEGRCGNLGEIDLWDLGSGELPLMGFVGRRT
jgi:hypothetical protein